MSDVKQQVKKQQIADTLEKLGVEPFVDADTVAAHLGFKGDHIRKLAVAGKIPASKIGNGKRVFWRFKISLVDEAFQKMESSFR